MTETRYLPGTSAPTTIDTGGAIVPTGTTSIARYAQDVYLALPPERQNQQSWAGLAQFAEQGDWNSLREIHAYFTTNNHSLTVSDNSSHVTTHSQHSYDNRSSSLSYADESQISYDDRTWESHYNYADNSALDYYNDQSQLAYSDDRSWITHDNRSWVTNSDDRQWVDNGSYHYAPTYAPVTHAPTYYVDNSIYLNVDIDDSFNGNGNNNGNSTQQLPEARPRYCQVQEHKVGDGCGWDRILWFFAWCLAIIFTWGILRTALAEMRSTPSYSPVEIR